MSYFEHCLQQVGRGLLNPTLGNQPMYRLGNNIGAKCTFLEYFRAEALAN